MRIGVGSRIAITIVTLTALGGACSKPAEPMKIASIDISNAIDANNNVISLSETYAVQSTVYASVATEGSGHGGT